MAGLMLRFETDSSVRPKAVYHAGVVVHIDVHDGWFLSERSRLLAAVRRFHPDCYHNEIRARISQMDTNRQRAALRAQIVAYTGTGPGSKYQAARRHLTSFLRAELKWYAQFGLHPPSRSRT